MRKFVLILIMLGSFTYSMAQVYLLPNEKTIFTFTAEKNKKMVLAKDSTDKYIIYRFGTNDKIELEFPNKSVDSWNKFTYSFYLRGGGTQNEGLDLNFVYFMNDNFKYIIYHTYSAADTESKCGIKVVNSITKKTVDISGQTNTIEGNLTDFRDNKLLEIGDETFE